MLAPINSFQFKFCLFRNKKRRNKAVKLKINALKLLRSNSKAKKQYKIEEVIIANNDILFTFKNEMLSIDFCLVKDIKFLIKFSLLL